jgi:SIR2-like domain
MPSARPIEYTTETIREALMNNDIDKLISAIRHAWHSNRSIVPIVGAGFSADSGIPIIRSVVRYFGKFQQFLTHRAYLPCPGGFLNHDPFHRLASMYQREPWKYVEHFGWPNRFQLNQDLLRLLGNSPDDETTSVADQVRVGLNFVVRGINQSGTYQFDKLYKDISTLLPKRGKLREKVLARLESRDTNSVLWDLVGDWKRLIQYFTRYQGDYADALFSALCAGRGPTQGHRYLSFLIKLLGIQTVLTFNFDDLIERALEDESIRPKVFAMAHGEGVPHDSLIRDTVSVLKLHGNNYSLLVDERLDHPLSQEYKLRLRRLFGPNPLVFVLGCSGDDYRLRDLLTYVLQVDSDRHAPVFPRVLWLHFDNDAPEFLKPFCNPRRGTSQPPVLTALTNNPGASIMHCYTALTGRHPASSSPYSTRVQKPAKLGVPGVPKEVPSTFTLAGVQVQIDACTSPFVVLSTLHLRLAATHYPLCTASERLVDVANMWLRRGYQTIWVELEAIHTLAAVVGSIIDQCRAYDPSVAPSVLPVDIADGPTTTEMETAVAQVAQALRRARYFVALDGFETYLWPPLSHHGFTKRTESTMDRRFAGLSRFINDLKETTIGESKFYISADQTKLRNVDTGGRIDDSKNKAMLRKHLRRSAADVLKVETPLSSYSAFFMPTPKLSFVYSIKECDATQPLYQYVYHVRTTKEQGHAYFAYMLVILAAFRRTRDMVALRHLLRLLIGARQSVEDVLRILEGIRPIGIFRTEGGSLWFNRTVRDYIYSQNSRFVSTRALAVCLLAKKGYRKYSEATAQLLQLTTTHQLIARVYYTRTFVLSQDATVFLDYTYHRISSIRYLTKLLALIRRARAETAAGGGRLYEDAALKGFRNFGTLLENALNTIEYRATAPGAYYARTVLGESLTRMEISENSAIWKAMKGESASLDAIETELQLRHVREVKSLYRAWVRSESALRAQIAAQQLLHWCECLATDDLPYRCNAVVVNYVKAEEGELMPVLWPDPSGSINLRAKPVIISFIRFLEQLRGKLWLDRADFTSCALRRWELLKDLKLLKTSAQLKKGDDIWQAEYFLPLKQRSVPDVESVQMWVDVVTCFVRNAQECAPSRKESGLREAKTLLNAIRRLVPDSLPGSTESGPATPPGRGRLVESGHKWEETLLRLDHLDIQISLRNMSVFAVAVYDEPPSPKIETATDEIERGLLRVRWQEPRTDGPPRSVIIDPTPDGSLYLPYRSIFNMLRGRTCWLNILFKDEPTNISQQTADEEFESAFRHFELARGGLGNGNALLCALIELYASEACLGRARIRLLPLQQTTAEEAAFAECIAKFDLARTALQRAREWLSRSRRNVLWWRLFYLMVSQYHADRMMVGYARVMCRIGAEALKQNRQINLDGLELPPFLARLRRGYNSVRSGLDYRLPGSEINSICWLKRTWRQMTFAGFGVAYAALYASIYCRPRSSQAVVEPPVWSDVPMYVWKSIEWINHSERLGLHEKDAIGRELSRLKPIAKAVTELGSDESVLTESAVAVKKMPVWTIASQILGYMRGIGIQRSAIELRNELCKLASIE